MVVFTVYRSPDFQPEDFINIMKNVDEVILLAQATGSKLSFVLGADDFNLKNISWPKTGMPPMENNNSIMGSQINSLLCFMNKHLLNQLVDTPTREESVLDLILSNNKSNISSIKQVVNTVLSDHNSLFMRMKVFPDALRAKNKQKEYYLTDLYKYDLR